LQYLLYYGRQSAFKRLPLRVGVEEERAEASEEVDLSDAPSLTIEAASTAMSKARRSATRTAWSGHRSPGRRRLPTRGLLWVGLRAFGRSSVSDADCDALRGPLAHPFSEGVPEHELVGLHEAGMTAD
jgi:hypothetical protein